MSAAFNACAAAWDAAEFPLEVMSVSATCVNGTLWIPVGVELCEIASNKAFELLVLQVGIRRPTWFHIAAPSEILLVHLAIRPCIH